eukprot:403375955
MKSIIKAKKIVLNNDLALKLEYSEEMSSDIIFQMFMLDKIFNGCEDIVHQNILSDTQKKKNKLTSQTLLRLEQLLRLEVKTLDLDIEQLEKQVDLEIQRIPDKKISDKKLIESVKPSTQSNDTSTTLSSFKLLRDAIIKKINQMISEKMSSKLSILSLMSDDEKFNVVKAQERQKNSFAQMSSGRGIPAINLQTPQGEKKNLLPAKESPYHAIEMKLKSRTEAKESRNSGSLISDGNVQGNSRNLKTLKEYTQNIKNGFISSDVLQFDVNKFYENVIDLRIKNKYASGSIQNAKKFTKNEDNLNQIPR